jgi:CheY-like chemotaxis protein
VLVVEDEPTIAASVAARMRAEGFRVDVAHDGPSAVAQAADAEPDLVVLDVMLPGFDGLEVCRRLHARRPVPVLMVTARFTVLRLLVLTCELWLGAAFALALVAALRLRPAGLRTMAAGMRLAEPDDWRSSNFSREAARATLHGLPTTASTCIAFGR